MFYCNDKSLYLGRRYCKMVIIQEWLLAAHKEYT